MILLAFYFVGGAMGFQTPILARKGMTSSSALSMAGSKSFISQSALVELLATKTGFHKNDVDKVIDAFREVLRDQVLLQGEEVRLKNMGTFKRKIITARQRRNIMTGEMFDAPEKHLVQFTVSPYLKVIPGEIADE